MLHRVGQPAMCQELLLIPTPATKVNSLGNGDLFLVQYGVMVLFVAEIQVYNLTGIIWHNLAYQLNVVYYPVMNRVSHIPNGTCYNSSSTKNAQKKSTHCEKCHIYLDLMRAIPCFAREIHDPHAMRKKLLRLNLLEVTSGQTLGVFRQISWEGVEWWATGEKNEYIYIYG